MKKIFTFIVASFMCTTYMWADKVTGSTTLPGDGRPEHVYTMANGNGAYANATTAPVSGDEENGLFAFYAVDGVTGAYYIYSHNAQKWLSYTKAASYSSGKGFVQMTDSKTEGAYFYVNNYSGDYYQIQPYTTSGVASIYLNWYQGVSANAGTTLGLWTDNGAADAGSRYTFTESVIVERTYTIVAPEGCNVAINGQTYSNGEQITVEGSIDKSAVSVTVADGEFAAVSVDDVNNTVTVSIATIPEQPASATYENAWVYPKQQDNVGVAVIAEGENVWTLSNNVLAASYMKLGNAIYFAGSNAMNLVAGTEPFTVAFGSGDNVPASAMTLTDVKVENLAANSNAIGGAEHFAGKALVANYKYTYNDTDIEIVWRAVLRDGSHYLRTEMELTGVDDVDMYNIIPMIYNVDTEAAGSTPAVVGNTRGAVLMSNKIFAGLETPTAYNTVGTATGEADPWELTQTLSPVSLTASSWTQVASADVPARVTEATGASYPNVLAYTMSDVALEANQKVEITVTYTSGNHRLNFGGADLLEASGDVAANDYHSGYSGGQHSNNTFTFIAPYSGTFSLRVFVEDITESIDASSTMSVNIYTAKEGATINTAIVGIQGRWSRNTTLAAGETWKVGAVVGLVAQDGSQEASDIHDTQKRRSFLAYSERERAVPWRAFPCYISWYELNIDRNNAAPGSEHTNMTADQVLDVLTNWKTNFFDKYGEGPAAFIIDDGWDNYGTWTFHSGFPNEMRDISSSAAEMGAGVGAWLGPVGGYGQSGNYRRSYWSSNGGMQLSNPLYYETFKTAAKNLVCNQDGQDGFNADTDNYIFFKFDGISAQFSATGPDAGDTGNENAEGIIRLERYVREELREDIFFNTTVGTWASPFWYQITDATWRQENDYGEAGNNSIDREKWITYRDRLVYQNYVTNSPICPINTLMTHGFILTNFGAVSENIDYDAVLRELRCAFVCGSGMVELYNDYSLMNSINDGQLWADLAECIAWQKKNADVLPDAHWVGGNPWTGSTQEVYGWASWNGTKATLALRNGSNSSQSYTFTLREALNIPANIFGSIILTKSFNVQDALTGLAEGEEIDIDQQLTVTLPASSVFAFDGEDANAPFDIVNVTPAEAVEELTTITVSFNGNIVSAFDETDVLKVSGESYEGTTTFAIEGRNLIITLDEMLDTPGEYTLEIPAGKIVRENDNSEFSGKVITLTVKAMETLTVASVTPAEGVESLSEISIVFNYDVQSTFEDTETLNLTGVDYEGTTTFTVEGKVLTVSLSEVLNTPGEYTLVIPAGKITRVKDGAEFAGQTFVFTVVEPDYYTPTNTGTRTRSDRNITAINLSSDLHGAQSYSLASSEQSQDYLDLTSTENYFIAAPGEEVTVSVTTGGSWIHHYVFIDLDANGFTASIADGSEYAPAEELFAYSFYNNNASSDASGWNSVGTVITGNDRNKPAIPSFTVPSNAGTYRMRIKQDWCNIDPMGDADGKFDDFKQNGGQIIDITFVVTDDTSISDIAEETMVKGIYDLTGRKLEQISAPGIYIVDGKKVLVK